MIITNTTEGFTRYQDNRDIYLPRLIEQTALLYGLPSLSFSIGQQYENSCKLSQDGVHININPSSIAEVVHRKQYGARGTLPLALADLIVVLHQINRAADYVDPSFFIELDDDSPSRRKARRFFNITIDDIVVDLRLLALPLIRRFFDAFSTRLTKHDLTELPMHLQYIQAIRLVTLEQSPSLLIDDEVREAVATFCQVKEVMLFDPKTPYKLRHERADELLYPKYLSFLREDLTRFDRYSIEMLHDEHSFFNEIESVSARDILSMPNAEIREFEDEIFKITDERIEQVATECPEEAKNAPEGDSDDTPGLILPRSGENPDDLTITAATSKAYHLAARRWHTTIDDISELLLKLASPKESITVPRYRNVAAIEGVRLNPTALVETFIQLDTASPRPIWQPIEQRIRYQELRFSGLDVYLLLDVSCSMGGENAEYASAMGVCLMEGLQLARYRAEMDAKQGEVDVRTQLLAFGAGWAELTPLCKEPSMLQRETAYYNLMNPSSNFTVINGALKHVKTGALTHPERDVMCLIISDGLFSDNLPAFSTTKGMPDNVYVGHINIGNSSGIPITLNHETVYDPKVLPKKLYLILEDYFARIDFGLAEYAR